MHVSQRGLEPTSNESVFLLQRIRRYSGSICFQTPREKGAMKDFVLFVRHPDGTGQDRAVPAPVGQVRSWRPEGRDAQGPRASWQLREAALEGASALCQGSVCSPRRACALCWLCWASHLPRVSCTFRTGVFSQSPQAGYRDIQL